jgi:hypothetical protein
MLMSNPAAVTVPTHDEYKVGWLSNGGEGVFKLLVIGAKLIHREKEIKYIAEHAKRDIIAGFSLDGELRKEIYKKMCEDGLSKEVISAMKFYSYMAQPGVAEDYLWAMKWLKKRNTVPGLKSKQAIEFLKQYDLDENAVS